MTIRTCPALPVSRSRDGGRSIIKRRGLGGLLALFGVLAVSATGCNFMQEPSCPKLEACGGELPIGRWILKQAGGSCSEDLYTPAVDTRLVQADLPAARLPPPEPALFDWCVLLLTSGGKDIMATAPRFFTESPPVGDASVKFDDNGTYSVGTTRTGTYTLDFPAYCMRAFGATDGKPAEEGGPPVGVCKQLEVPLRASGLGEGAYRNTTCEINEADPGGCLCQFDASAAGGSSGSFQRISGNTLLSLPFTDFPQKVTFCRDGDRLQLTGGDGQYLFDQKGLRTLDLVKAQD